MRSNVVSLNSTGGESSCASYQIPAKYFVSPSRLLKLRASPATAFSLSVGSVRCRLEYVSNTSRQAFRSEVSEGLDPSIRDRFFRLFAGGRRVIKLSAFQACMSSFILARSSSKSHSHLLQAEHCQESSSDPKTRRRGESSRSCSTQDRVQIGIRPSLTWKLGWRRLCL